MADSGETPAVSRPYREGLVGLPTELTSQILGYIRRPSEKVGVVAVCKQLQKVMLPLLYHTVFLKIRSPEPSTAITEFLSSSNPGRGMIRDLYILISGDRTTCGPMVLLIVSTLPCDTLRRLSSDCMFTQNGSLATRLLDVISRQQRELVALGLHELDPVQLFRHEPTGLLQTCKKLKHISCKPSIGVRLGGTEASNSSLHSASLSRLEKLNMSFHDVTVADGHAYTKDQRCEATTALLKSFLPIEASLHTATTHDDLQRCLEKPCASLQHLALKHGYLGEPSALVLTCVFHISSLESLTLYRCSFVLPLLRKFRDLGSNIRLHTLEIVTRDIGSLATECTKGLLNSFIGGFGGLRVLVLDIRNFFSTVPVAIPSVYAVVQHARTLERLCLEFGDHASGLYSVGQMQFLGQSCSRLEQLSLVFPRVPLSCDILGGPDIDTGATPTSNFSECMAAVASLPRLRTLQLRRVPTTIYAQCNADSPDLRNADYLRFRLQEFSTRIFANPFKDKPLNVLAWGHHRGPPKALTLAPHGPAQLDQTHECDVWTKRLAYTRSILCDLGGRKHITAMLSTGGLEYLEPAIEVLQVSEEG